MDVQHQAQGGTKKLEGPVFTTRQDLDQCQEKTHVCTKYAFGV